MVIADVRRLWMRCYDSVQLQPRDCVEFQLTGNDVMEWRHRAAGRLLADLLAGRRLRRRHIFRDGLVCAQLGSGHGRQLPVGISVLFRFRLYFRFCGSPWTSFTDVSRTITFPDRHFPDKTFPGQVILRNFHVHTVCKYPLYRPSHTICRYTERLLMCACRPAVSIRGLFGKACSPTMGKA